MADRTPPWVQPWSEPTVETAPGTAGGPAFNRGVAQVNPRRAAPPSHTGQFPTAEERWSQGDRWRPREPRVRFQPERGQLGRGAGWTWTGGLWAFVCWGIWAVSVRGADLVVPAVAFALVLLVAAGVFVLSRLVGRAILERVLNRRRRGAWGSHLITGVFLFGAGVAYLGQTAWVIDAWNWLRGLAG